jgi:hypothetical protein
MSTGFGIIGCRMIASFHAHAIAGSSRNQMATSGKLLLGLFARSRLLRKATLPGCGSSDEKFRVRFSGQRGVTYREKLNAAVSRNPNEPASADAKPAQ